VKKFSALIFSRSSAAWAVAPRLTAKDAQSVRDFIVGRFCMVSFPYWFVIGEEETMDIIPEK
jgi:hypothetical protein